ncbi:sensor histidine kinase [Aquimarina hainanensis]|uniref:histidine kinase n=1 Tax=Aquimarina hainanensis TaxID=1578017 RepID=A0ABW5N8A0_9FLAO
MLKSFQKNILIILLGCFPFIYAQKAVEEISAFPAKKIAPEVQKKELAKLRITTELGIADRLFVQKDINAAAAIYKKILKEAIPSNLLKEQAEIYHKLKLIALQKDDYKSAFALSSQYFVIKDSINALERLKKITFLENKYQKLQKEKEKLTLLNKEDELRHIDLQKDIQRKENENQILFLKNTAERRRNEIILLKKDKQLKELEINRQKEIKKITFISFIITLIPIIGLLILYYQKLKTQSLLNKKLKEIGQQRISTILKDQELKLIRASIEGQDRERKRIAQELHDSIGGNLAAIKLQFSNLSKDRGKFKTLYHQLDDTYQQVRTLSHNLIPTKFRQNDFVPLITEYMKNIEEASKLKVMLSIYPEDDINNEIDEKLQNEIFIILQELITNTIKHSGATRLDIQIDLIHDTIHLIFEDNGIGFSCALITPGVGLTSLKRRLKALDGVYTIDSRHKRGTIINIEIPNKKHIIL